ncbi:MAG: HDIG domain-containing protein [Candidatus Omnitrophica bacterium]|nr:HDIG domain-containing protein [Candidatus Omnitrophota bacterium]
MIAKFSESVRKNIKDILLASVFIVVLTVFCYFIEYSLIIPFFLLFLGIHLRHCGKGTFKTFLNLGLLLTLILFTAHVVIFYTDWPVFYIPVAGIAMLTMLLFNDLHLSFLMGLASSVLVSVFLHGDFGMMMTFFLGSLAGTYSVRDARARDQLMSAGLFVSVIHLVCLVLLNPDVSLFIDKAFSRNYLYPLASNGIFSALLVVATLKIFEQLFHVLTNFSLLEIADSNRPLLKRMALEAPGTWQHSLTVSQLSEAAADAIGANPLLTRAGAYYHDIGKLAKSEYFTENQMLTDNKHDYIEPSMSRLVILNHVKEGIELARKNKVHPIIVDFIPQHHGTSLIYYFYQKALEVAEEGETVSEENFRYPGPKPQTKETAIILLADSVEGALRALDDTTPTKIEETVKKIVNNKFIDGQLDECSLTLKEIDKISSTFIRILSVMYHARIKYPEKKNGNSIRKSTEKGSAQPSPDSQDYKDDPSA